MYAKKKYSLSYQLNTIIRIYILEDFNNSAYVDVKIAFICLWFWSNWIDEKDMLEW